jgi:F plasmid transfer operon protein TraF
MVVEAVRLKIRVAAAMAVLSVLPMRAAAQSSFEVVGPRALGMAGAFVAVANDPSAVHWNPAGLATGSPVGMTFEWDRFQTGNQKAPAAPGPAQASTGFTSIATMPLGLSYGRFKTTQLVGTPAGQLHAQTLTIGQFGVTLVQTIVQGLVVGSTVKFERGTPAFGPVSGQTVDDALDAGSDLDGETKTQVDFDIGVMADLRKLRIGVTSKNLRSPEFGAIAGIAVGLQRRTRLGVSVLPTAGLTFALDVDLDTADLSDGLRRMIALGGESRLGTRAAVRGGVRWSRDDSGRTIGSVGGSVMIRRNFWIDGYYTQGRHDEDRGYGIALRAGM